ncbi:S8 family peptidase [Sulfitobacter mediterraneus]|uniref:S8 family peptidase n=2 Tax=Sulfitobacter mediterraneus TaxID=83219 RepID=UPI00193A3095|nr:S8 family peptidase [Sulfitobacter mediterraneus]MBM1645748.1 S8 family peptidase [Sulfitobacter mediterraneus]MBM1653817.1 S8 family peptidase [Sulfitobacter mediterraneus]MBM1657815.1 S8 family peptidase [Sulfitobacter mediterraneus]MBM1665980.1 S8 family peptidase [Sulfitobacter mediterraneus]
MRGDLATLGNHVREIRREQKDLGIPADKCGVTVAVSSREGQQLEVGDSRRANSRGMKLLNVQRSADTRGQRGRDRAIYFLTENAIKSLDSSLSKYHDWVDEDSASATLNVFDEGNGNELGNGNRPRNFWLFESASSFRVAKLEDLWTDPQENFPREKGAVEWEIWVRSPQRAYFDTAVVRLGIKLTGHPTEFTDITVYNGLATKASLERLIEQSAAVVELRGASNFIAEHALLPPPERLQQIQQIAQRVIPAPASAPWISLLDTGVNWSHPLLSSSLPAERCQTVATAWNRFDSDGHGSKMAGIALYGDLGEVASIAGPVTLETGLESIVVFDPKSSVRIPARDAILRGITEAETRAAHPRVYCLAATTVGEPEDGRPTSTSSTLDALAFDRGTQMRLFCVAVGNVEATITEPYQTQFYATLNGEHGIQSPAQALNVLAVGALTNKSSGPSPLAIAGGLSPRSRTAKPWEIRRHKPDILMEGGNHGIDPSGTTSRPHGPDMIATTSNDPVRQPITLTGDTSAACAAAARLAGRVMARYPAMRPETVRGLIVHSAEWTPTMWAHWQTLIDAGESEQQATLSLLDCFGWGVPNEERLFWSAENALTLISEDELRPYKKEEGKSVTLKEMKSVRLPWPDAALRALAATEIELRCTLSYFIQPDLHSAGLDRQQYYPSHGLKFDFQRFGESEERTRKRVNKAIISHDPQASDEGWVLGRENRPRGTLHHDIWRGPAYQLVDRQMITVTPMRGWWANGGLEVADVPVRYSLIVSIRTPQTANDLVAEVRSLIPANLLVDVPSVVRT